MEDIKEGERCAAYGARALRDGLVALRIVVMV